MFCVLQLFKDLLTFRTQAVHSAEVVIEFAAVCYRGPGLGIAALSSQRGRVVDHWERQIVGRGRIEVLEVTIAEKLILGHGVDFAAASRFHVDDHKSSDEDSDENQKSDTQC